MLWALLAWDVPFRGMDQMQILVAVAYHNKRPTMKDLEDQWPPQVLELIRDLWDTDPTQRPSMKDARNILKSFVKTTTTAINS